LPAVGLQQRGNRILRDGRELPAATDIFQAVDDALEDLQHGHALPEAILGLPFQGGALGCFGYRDMARIGIYLWAIVVDHHRRQTLFFALPHCASQTLQQALFCLEDTPPTAGAFTLDSALTSNFDADSYARAFDQVQAYIH